MNTYIVSIIRTYSPILVGVAISWLASFGITLDGSTEAALAAGIAAVGAGAYYALVRALEGRWPWLGLLLGAAKAPSYPATSATRKESKHAA